MLCGSLQQVQQYLLRVLGQQGGTSMLAKLSTSAVLTLVVENFVAITRKQNPNPSALQHALMVPVVVREQHKKSVAGFSYYTGSKQHYGELGSLPGCASGTAADACAAEGGGILSSSCSSEVQQILQVAEKLAAEKLSRSTRAVLSRSSSSSSDAAAQARVKQQMQDDNELHVQFCSDIGRACRQQHVRGAHTQEVRGRGPLLLSLLTTHQQQLLLVCR